MVLLHALRLAAIADWYVGCVSCFQSMDMDRRAVVKSAALGAAVAAPKLANAFECSPGEIDKTTGACPVPKNDVDKPSRSLAPSFRSLTTVAARAPAQSTRASPRAT